MRAKVLTALGLAPLCLAAQTAADSRRIYHERYAARMETLLCEAVAFRTEAGNKEAIAQQARWLGRQAKQLGLTYRNAGPVTEIELPGPPGAPVLGLVVHGDVQPAGESEWTVPPYKCTLKGDNVYGRGVADDKGPLVQGLLAITALRDSGRARTHTIRLLVGSDEESDNLDIATYLKSHAPPNLTLVIDSAFPVVVGEKAWDRLDVTAGDPYPMRRVNGQTWRIVQVEAGIAASIVPPRATARLQRIVPLKPNTLQGKPEDLCRQKLPTGFHCEVKADGEDTTLVVTGRAAHAGVNIEGGRNALVLLANLLGQGTVGVSGASDLLEFAAMAGKDLYGTGLGLTQADPLWGRYNVNVATLKPVPGGELQLAINLRRPPPRTHQEMQTYLERIVADFNRLHGTSLRAGGYFKDEPLAFDPNSKIVKRLLADYARATGGNARPAISGGATYAKRMPNAIAFGMWFPGKPYPGHDVDEHIATADLHRGVDVLLEALADLACSPPMAAAFAR